MLIDAMVCNHFFLGACCPAHCRASSWLSQATKIFQNLQCWENWWRTRRCLGSLNHHILRLCGLSASSVPSHKANLHGWWPWNLISVHNAYPRDAHAFGSEVIQKLVQLLPQTRQPISNIMCCLRIHPPRRLSAIKLLNPAYWGP